jgi:anti-anti-sigma regulatory factor
MSCKIDRLIRGENLVILRVSGRIHAENVETLKESLGLETDRIAIDLKEVTLVDRQAVRLLAFSETKGVELRNCPAYIREWVTGERNHIGGVVSDPEEER